MTSSTRVRLDRASSGGSVSRWPAITTSARYRATGSCPDLTCWRRPLVQEFNEPVAAAPVSALPPGDAFADEGRLAGPAVPQRDDDADRSPYAQLAASPAQGGVHHARHAVGLGDRQLDVVEHPGAAVDDDESGAPRGLRAG